MTEYQILITLVSLLAGSIITLAATLVCVEHNIHQYLSDSKIRIAEQINEATLALAQPIK